MMDQSDYSISLSMALHHDEVVDASQHQKVLLEQCPSSYLHHDRRTIPNFDTDDIKAGLHIGRGQFGIVSEVIQIKGNFGKTLLDNWPKTNRKSGNNHMSGHDSLMAMLYHDHDDQTEFTASMSGSDHGASWCWDSFGHGNTNSDYGNNDGKLCEKFDSSMKSILSQTVTCDDEEGLGRYRYAVKRLRADLDETKKDMGVIDLATEASLLHSISHPNVVRLRATIGTAGSPDFMLLLDRLYDTVAERIQQWKKSIKGRCPSLRLTTNNAMRKDLISRVTVAYDMAKALRYIHNKRIIHRDLKPENAAFNVQGEVCLFDFGLSRKLTEKDLVDGTDGYHCTGKVGSLRWMAPEVYCGKLYGRSADVHSFGLLIWQLCSLQIPYGRNMSVEQLEAKVIKQGERPQRLFFVPDGLNELMSKCWSSDPSRRPSFDEICVALESEISDESHL